MHIGLPKTGTTFLQEKVFSNSPKNIIYNPAVFKELYKLFIKSEIIDTILLNKINECYKFLSKNENKKVLISNEGWSHDEYSFRFERRISFLSKYFKHAHILLIFRNKEDWIISMYLQSIQQGNIQEFKDFITTKNTNYFRNCRTTNHLPSLNILEIDYNKLKNFVQTNFDNKPLFLDYDKNLDENIDLIEKVFLKQKIYNSTNQNKIKVNRSLSGLSIKIIISIKKILPRFFYNLMYNENIPLYKKSEKKNSILTWVKIRNFFQNYLDNLIYLDFNIKKNYYKILKNYLK
tara:strand:+ start:454 stop:1326 length:873 start_codon:yes stop_codon:yes gene_type:complete